MTFFRKLDLKTKTFLDKAMLGAFTGANNIVGVGVGMVSKFLCTYSRVNKRITSLYAMLGTAYTNKFCTSYAVLGTVYSSNKFCTSSDSKEKEGEDTIVITDANSTPDAETSYSENGYERIWLELRKKFPDVSDEEIDDLTLELRYKEIKEQREKASILAEESEPKTSIILILYLLSLNLILMKISRGNIIGNIIWIN